MNDQGLGVAYIGQIGENFQVIDEVSGCLESVLQFDGEDGACAFRQVFLLEFMVGRGFQARIVDLCHFRMFFQEFRQFLGVGHVTFYAERQCFQPLDEEPGRNRRNGCAGIAEDFGTNAGNKACPRDVGGKIDAMVGCVGIGKMRISFRLVPVELAVFNDGAAKGCTVAADEFGGGVDDYIQAVFQRTEEVRGWQRCCR